MPIHGGDSHAAAIRDSVFALKPKLRQDTERCAELPRWPRRPTVRNEVDVAVVLSMKGLLVGRGEVPEARESPDGRMGAVDRREHG